MWASDCAGLLSIGVYRVKRNRWHREQKKEGKSRKGTRVEMETELDKEQAERELESGKDRTERVRLKQKQHIR
jgi:hypothetical protein